MENYTRLGELGGGAFGVVYRAQDKRNGQEVAIKYLAINHANKYLAREIVNHSLLCHPHIVAFKEAFLTDTHLCIAMEYANGGRLFDKVRNEKRLQEPIARWFFQQLIFALDFSHKRGVANRDIKLENLLLHKEPDSFCPLIKMCDFGYSKSNHESAAKTQVGTVSYMAPEVVSAVPGGTYDARKADVWSCGVVLYVMLYGVYPFDCQDDAKLQPGHRLRRMLQRMQGEAYVLPPGVAVSSTLSGLLKGLLQPDPLKRFTLAEVMRHPWFTSSLPKEAHAMNEWYLAQPPPEVQSREQIEQLIKKAQGAR